MIPRTIGRWSESMWDTRVDPGGAVKRFEWRHPATTVQGAQLLELHYFALARCPIGDLENVIVPTMRKMCLHNAVIGVVVCPAPSVHGDFQFFRADQN